MSIEGQGHFLAQGHLRMKIKLAYLRNRLAANKRFKVNLGLGNTENVWTGFDS